MHIQQTHIAMHEKLTWRVGVRVDAQMPRNQKTQGGRFGTVGAITALVRV